MLVTKKEGIASGESLLKSVCSRRTKRDEDYLGRVIGVILQDFAPFVSTTELHELVVCRGSMWGKAVERC